MKTITLQSSDVISLLSAFEKLIFLGKYNLTVEDVELVNKTLSVINERKLATLKSGYPLVFQELKKHKKETIVCVAEFRLGSSSYSKEFKGESENEITDLINEELEVKNAHYISSKNI